MLDPGPLRVRECDVVIRPIESLELALENVIGACPLPLTITKKAKRIPSAVPGAPLSASNDAIIDVSMAQGIFHAHYR